DVLAAHEPEHLLLRQAEEEVLEQTFDFAALASALARCGQSELLLKSPKRLTPLAFPLWAESIRGGLSSEDWKARVQRIARELERAQT
ncbi:MAG: DNA ligase-associated DEXH box helicase, partial [Dokdonella sp.]